MPTVHMDTRRDFASPVAASLHRHIAAWRRVHRPLAAAALAIIFASALSGCTGFGLIGGKSDGSRAGSRQETPKPDAFAAARAQMAAAPREAYWPFHLAELYVAADSSAAAIANLNAALALDAGYAPAVSLLSRIYYDVKMHAQAVSLLEGYLARAPEAPDALRASLALHYEALGDGEKADAALSACAPDAEAAATARVLATLRQNDGAAMLDAARRALAADRDNPVHHNNYGIALLVSGRPLEARDAFREALDIDESLPGALYNMAIVETFYLFDDGAGREWYTRYLRVASDDPDNLKAHFEADVSTARPGRH